ncbi:MAG: TetR/AcrR family transcriptional regulator [Ignavibacteriae bacterium]|nr:TetR/AcrR family transcriptional regulator [Ignavibacteriota bacterium]NOG97952.1 TetR/AcrR family transcriptional regulator [Ignavibacteriota bacterium]
MPRTPEQNKLLREKTSKKILEAALKLFARKGFHGTSMSDIAEAAGVSKGLAYNYYKSKKHLLEALLILMQEMSNQVEIVMNKSDDPFEKLKLIINYSFKYVKDNEEFWLLYMGIIFQPSVLKSSVLIFDEVYDSMYKVFEQIFRRIGMKNAVAEARIFGGLFDGIFLGYLMNKDKYPLEKVRKQMLKRYSKIELQKLL